MACSGYIGWQGAASAGGTLPFISGDIRRVTQLFKPNIIGWSNNPAFRSPYNYAKASSYVEGSFTCEIFGGSYSSIGSLISACVNGTEVNLSLSSGGGSGISIPGDGICYVSSMTLNGSNGGISKVTFNILATDADDGGAGSASLDYESEGITEDNNPIPYYNTSFVMTGVDSDMVMEWSLTFSNNPRMINVLNGESRPITIRLGTTSLTGTVSYLTSSVSAIEDGGTLTVDCGPRTLTCPWIVVTGDSKPSNGQNQIVTRTLSFEGFGSDGQKVLSV